MTLPRCILVDLDMTLCDCSHRLHHVDAEYYYENIHGAEKLYEKVLWSWDDPDSGYIYRHTFTHKEFISDWDAFYAAMGDDKCNEWCHEILTNLPHYYLLFITNRPEKYWRETIYWLDRHDLPTDEKYMKLFMRPDFLPCPHNPPNEYILCPKCIKSYPLPDHRPSPEVKREIYQREIKNKYEVLVVLEDDEQCAEMYKSLGLVVLRVMP